MTTRRLVDQLSGARGPVLTPVKPDDGDREDRILAHQRRVQAEVARLHPPVTRAANPEKACRACGAPFRGGNGAWRCWRCIRDRVYSKAV